MKKVLISVANERLAYVPVLEVELEERDLEGLLDSVKARAEEEPEGESEPEGDPNPEE